LKERKLLGSSAAIQASRFVKLVVGHSIQARNFGVKQLVCSSASNSSKHLQGEAACGFISKQSKEAVLGKQATCSRFISDFKVDLRSEVLGLYFVFYPLNGSVRNSKEKRKKRNRRGRKPRERAMQKVRAKVVHAQKAVQETFFSVKEIFEKHNVVFTIGASLASAGAAWAGYTARQMHQKKVEERLNSIEHAMTTVHNLEEEQVKALTSGIGVSYTACAATAGTTFVIG
jgi:hypothetical protein